MGTQQVFAGDCFQRLHCAFITARIRMLAIEHFRKFLRGNGRRIILRCFNAGHNLCTDAINSSLIKAWFLNRQRQHVKSRRAVFLQHSHTAGNIILCGAEAHFGTDIIQSFLIGIRRHIARTFIE